MTVTINGNPPSAIQKQELAQAFGLASSNSPALTGAPTAPTAPAGTNTTQIASTAFVKGEVDAAAATSANALVDERSAVATLTNKTITGGTTNPTTLQEGGVAAVVQTDIGTAPNEIPLNQYLGNLAYMDGSNAVLNPPPSITPVGIGDMVFQLTDNTTLVVKVKGSDGTVRAATLTLT